jgi:hypothetical protein
VEANTQHSKFNVQHSQADSDAEMSSEERREMGARALEMLYDLFHGGQDILAIESHDELLERHAALKATKEEAPTSAGKVGEEHKIQHPTSNSQHPVEGGKGGKGEKEQGGTDLTQGGEGAEPATCNFQPATESLAELQPSTCNLQPSVEEANKVVNEWYKKARGLGGIVVNQWDVAELKAYLSGQPTEWYNVNISDREIMYPPTRDPRYNPESPWCRAWKCIEQERKANERN